MGTTAKVKKRKPSQKVGYSIGDKFEKPGYGRYMLCQVDTGITKLISLSNANRYCDIAVPRSERYRHLGFYIDPQDFYAAWGRWKKIS